MSKYKTKLIDGKLVLTSTDIQVGDTIDHDEHLGSKLIVTERTIDLVRQRNDPNYKFKGLTSFKVIGEVSPEAIWVKEGMEFDEAEVQFVNKWNGQNTPPDLYYKIKCSQCNTFH